jgi:hypothetical protein
VGVVAYLGVGDLELLLRGEAEEDLGELDVGFLFNIKKRTNE